MDYKVFIAKTSTLVGTLSYELVTNNAADTKLILLFTFDGTTLQGAISSVGTGFAAGTTNWIRVTRSSTSGDVIFYTSLDGITWAQLGATVSTSTGALYDGATSLTLGGYTSGSAYFNDIKIYQAQIYNGINGTLAVDFNPARDAITPTGSITSSTTGEVWTLNGASSIVRNNTYHGTGVDGVKCFDTTLAGVPIPAATLKGYLAEGQRTNHFKVSAAPATQTSASLSTGTYTLWMDGTGSITIAGATATITGAGTANSGTAITFTVTVAGTVTYTVTGSPTRAQSEDGPTRTSYIDVPSTTAVTRNADVLTYPDTGNVLGTVGTCYTEVMFLNGASSTNPPRIITANSAAERNLLYVLGTLGGKGRLSNYDGTSIATEVGYTVDIGGALNKVAGSWRGSASTVAIGGLSNSGTFDGDFNVNELRIGNLFAAGYELNGNIADVCIWTRKLPDAILKRISK